MNKEEAENLHSKIQFVYENLCEACELMPNDYFNCGVKVGESVRALHLILDELEKITFPKK